MVKWDQSKTFKILLFQPKMAEMLTIQNSSAGQTTFFGRTNAKKVVSWQDKCQKSSILAGQIPKSSILVGQMPFW